MAWQDLPMISIGIFLGLDFLQVMRRVFSRKTEHEIGELEIRSDTRVAVWQIAKTTQLPAKVSGGRHVEEWRPSGCGLPTSPRHICLLKSALPLKLVLKISE
ncbi:MAG: hypothetical protein V1784_10570 [bacterium]